MMQRRLPIANCRLPIGRLAPFPLNRHSAFGIRHSSFGHSH